jgi:hypothetical protein
MTAATAARSRASGPSLSAAGTSPLPDLAFARRVSVEE